MPAPRKEAQVREAYRNAAKAGKPEPRLIISAKTRQRGVCGIRRRQSYARCHCLDPAEPEEERTVPTIYARLDQEADYRRGEGRAADPEVGAGR